MGFFDALRRVLTHDTHAHVDRRDEEEDPRCLGPRRGGARLRRAKSGRPPRTGRTASAYDRSQWDKKLRKILEDLPGSQPSWHDLMTEAHALEFDPAWIAERQREGFAFLIRKAVSDRVVSEDDHHKLDLARKLIGFSEAEAERVLARDHGRGRGLLRLAREGRGLSESPVRGS